MRYFVVFRSAFKRGRDAASGGCNGFVRVTCAIIVCGLLIFSSSACETVFSKNVKSENYFRTSNIFNLIQIPIIDQAKGETCGIACLQSVLLFYDLSKSYYEDELAHTLQVDSNVGVLVNKVVAFAKSRGFEVDYSKDMALERLMAYIDDGKPVIVIIQAWPGEVPVDWNTLGDDGHYVVAVGYDRENIYFMDPIISGQYGYIPRDEFMDRWHLVDDEWGEEERIEHFGMVIWKESAPQFDNGRVKRIQ